MHGDGAPSHAVTKGLAPAALAGICVLFALLSTIGITWGLPSRDVDEHLFPSQDPWSGDKIYALANASEKFDATRGADVDPDPLDKTTLSNEPILLTGSDEDLAKIYLRYRLFTYQPDEMITMMSLAGMSPGRLDFDPRLYQYGGLFIYPVGALIKLCDVLSIIDVRGDVTYYLDDPDEFGKFYVVARAYSAAWGLVGVVLVFFITRRLADGDSREEDEGSRDQGIEGSGGKAATKRRSDEATEEGDRAGGPRSVGSGLRTEGNASSPHHTDDNPHGCHAFAQQNNAEENGIGEGDLSVRDVAPERHPDRVFAGLLAALLFTLLPVVVCMTHEGKPHLPGAVLMLASVWFAMRHMSRVHATGEGSARNWWLMCVACGAALGMVLSSLPIFVLIPLVAWMGRHDGTTPSEKAGSVRWVARTGLGVAVAAAAYLVTNPYVLINALCSPEVIASNLGNSTAMYEIDRIGAGFVRVLELTVEGATLPIVILGAIAMIGALARRSRIAVPLIIAAGVFFLQFVLIGAGKPGEYGRFGIFPNAALAIGAACLLAKSGPVSNKRLVRVGVSAVVVFWTGLFAGAYLCNFQIDTTPAASRLRARRALESAFALPDHRIALTADPAPYSCPPLPFGEVDACLFSDVSAARAARHDAKDRWILVRTRDERPIIDDRIATPGTHANDNVPFSWPTPISWANKPIEVHGPGERLAP